eukprot:350586-Chlamydomonas_euryale.AAC.2
MAAWIAELGMPGRIHHCMKASMHARMRAHTAACVATLLHAWAHRRIATKCAAGASMLSVAPMPRGNADSQGATMALREALAKCFDLREPRADRLFSALEAAGADAAKVPHTDDARASYVEVRRRQTRTPPCVGFATH